MKRVKGTKIRPGPNEKGDPFWCIMEWKNNQLTGNIFYGPSEICLFLDEYTAQRTINVLPNPRSWTARGMNKAFFNVLINEVEKKKCVDLFYWCLRLLVKNFQQLSLHSRKQNFFLAIEDSSTRILTLF